MTQGPLTPRLDPSLLGMRVGIVFHKDPFAPPKGIDLVRLRAIARGLMERGAQVEILSPVAREDLVDGIIPARNVRVLQESPPPYDLIKTCYHPSINLLGRYKGPVVSRIVRVVDRELPERDAAVREQLLRCQERIRERSSVLVLNNRENQERWHALYGSKLRVVLVPTGCPTEIPDLAATPYEASERVVLFLGSVAAPRMVRLLNEASRSLRDVARVHLVGLNKAHMYGGSGLELDPSIVDHGEVCEGETWGLVRHAAMGLALATGPHAFDNDVSKILNYLRGGLPVLSEEPIVNNGLIRETGFGKIFRYEDAADLAGKARELLEDPMTDAKDRVMRFMAQEHSWDTRVETYVRLFSQMVDTTHRV
jgi:glycosyltransferase involved in cell wall biosynthesis